MDNKIYIKEKISSFISTMSNEYIASIIIAIVNIFVVIFNNTLDNQYLIGTLLIITNVLLAYRVRKSKMLLFLIGIIAYINISIALIQCYSGGSMFQEYQWYISHSVYSLIYAKATLLNISIISLMVTPSITKKSAEAISSFGTIERKSNPIISYIGLAGILYILIFCVTRSSGAGYIASENPLYEYGTLIFVMVWYYSKNNKWANIVLAIFALVYMGQGLMYGDRSSAFILGALIITAWFKKTPGLKIVPLAAIAIFAANIVAVYRELESHGIREFIAEFLKKGILFFFSDTAAQSFYTGTLIVATRTLIKNPIAYLWRFIVSIFVGGRASISKGSILTDITSEIFRTPGGGIYPSYFYFWGGFLGVIIGAIIIGYVIRIAYTNQTSYFTLLKYLITVICLRWYLYAPLPLFRTCLLVFSTLFFLCFVFDLSKNNILKSIKDKKDTTYLS